MHRVVDSDELAEEELLLVLGGVLETVFGEMLPVEALAFGVVATAVVLVADKVEEHHLGLRVLVERGKNARDGIGASNGTDEAGLPVLQDVVLFPAGFGFAAKGVAARDKALPPLLVMLLQPGGALLLG